MLARSEEYKWSSYHLNAWGEVNWLTPHVEYLRLGKESMTRYFAYRELFKSQICEQDLHIIRKAAQFCKAIETKYGIVLGRTKRGRPGKTDTGLVKE